jgi:hypothetical protein
MAGKVLKKVLKAFFELPIKKVQPAAHGIWLERGVVDNPKWVVPFPVVPLIIKGGGRA